MKVLADGWMPRLQWDIVRSGVSSCRWTVTMFIGVTAVASACGVVAPLVIARVVQAQGVTSAEMLMAFVLFAGAIAAARFLQDVRMVLMNRVQQRVGTLANDTVMRRILGADSSLVASNNPARISSIVQNFEQSNKLYVQMFLMAFISCVFDVALSFIVIGSYIDWTVGVAVVAYGFCTVWLTMRANKITNKYLKLAQRKGNDSANLLGNVIGNIIALKIFRGIEWVVGLNDRYFRESRQGWNNFYSRRIGFGVLQGGLILIQYIVVFGLVMWEGGDAIRPAQLIVLVMVLIQLNRPFEMIATSLRDFTIAKSMAAPLQDLLEEYAPPARNAHAALPVGIELDVVLDGVGYRYHADTASVLRGISVVLAPGRINFIVGPSGIGKSTLMGILLGTNTGYTGSIIIGGTELSALEPEAYWDRIGYVPQESMMMNASIRENILFGRSFTDQEIVAALESVELGPKLTDLEEGLDFQIGERGALLSGGERQRLALARALIGKPSVLLLDEPSSALDEATERSIFARLRRSADAMTIIAITHRTGLIQTADFVLSLDKTMNEPVLTAG